MSVPLPCDILTSTVFSQLAPNPADPPYSYNGLCTAISTWNTANTGSQIFMGATELDRKKELAAFLGNTLHESGDFVYPREISPCGTTANLDGSTPWTSGTLYCQPGGYSPGQGSFTDYCSLSHTPSSNPAGCGCSAVPETGVAGYEANKLFFGRGPIQLSWNYNYHSAGTALGYDLCGNPDLVATDGAVAWGTAIWFWMVNTGAHGKTCHEAVATDGSFGEALNTINGGLECTTATAHRASVVSRLDDYCRASRAFGVNVLSFAGCTDLQTVYESCIAGGAGTWGTCSACDGIPPSPTANPTPTASPTTPRPTAPPTTPRPTAPPTNRPTKSPSPFLWYPDWNGANYGCKADGDEPPFMSPSYMYTEQSTCCSAHYNWMYDTCINGEDGIETGTGLYFPDWSTTGSCKLDEGDAPAYMKNAPTMWMRSDLVDCCSHWFNWKYTECAGTAPTPAAATGLWYPNWEKGTNECLNDGNQPQYMSNNPAQYLHSSLESCCDWNYAWTRNTCLGGQGAVGGTSKWYLDWYSGSNGACVLDCPSGDGGSCGGLAEPWETLWISKSECCTNMKGWDEFCISN